VKQVNEVDAMDLQVAELNIEDHYSDKLLSLLKMMNIERK